MSRLTQALHAMAGSGGGGLLETDTRQPGVLDMLGGLVRLPFDALNGTIQEIRARPEILRAQLESMRMRRDALMRLQAQMQGGQPPQQGMAPPQGGIQVQGAGQEVPMGQDAMPDPAGLPPMTPPPPPGGSGPPQPGRTPGTERFRRMAPDLAQAALVGIRGADNAGTILNNAQESVATENGVPYDRNTGLPVGPRIGANLTSVNSSMIDQQDPNNANRFVPEAPVRGAVPLYDSAEAASAGRPTAWRMPDGAVQAIAAVAGAETGGRTQNSITSAVGPDGRTQSGYAGTIYGQAPGTGGPGGMVTGPAPGAGQYANDTARSAAARYETIQAAGTSATSRITQLRQIGTMLEGYDGNLASPIGVRINQFAQSLGLRLDPNLGAQEAAQAIGNQLALSLRTNMPGPLSNSDREFLVGLSPNLAQSAEGRRILIQAETARAQREADTARLARAWQQRYGRIDAVDGQGRSFEDQMQRWADAHPLFTRPQGRR